jgi:Ca-activated chloride channel homolog
MSRRSLPATAAAVPLLLCLCIWCAELPAARIRVDSSLVLVRVSVTDAVGLPVTGLAKENFHLFEDDVEQTVAHFSLEDAPVSVGLLFDASGSMHNKMNQSSEAVASFMHCANAADEFFLVQFNEKPRLTVPFTADSGNILDQVGRTRPFGRTSLLDAIHVALVQMKSARNQRKAILILSDGGDNHSRFSRGEIRDAVLESDVQLYAIGIFEQTDPHKLTPEERGGPQLLSALADHSGGQLYTVGNLDDLAATGARIGNELRTQYLIGYFSSNPVRDGKYRHIGLKLDVPRTDLRASYRRGYYPPE